MRGRKEKNGGKDGEAAREKKSGKKKLKEKKGGR